LSVTRARRMAALAAITLCVIALGACSPKPTALAAAPLSPSAGPSGARPAAEVETIHHTLLIPGSEVLYSVESAPPTVSSAWASVEDGAAKVVEGADQLARGRDTADGWTALAGQLGQAARASGAASAAANPDQLRVANEQLAAACTGCHQAFSKQKP